MIEAYEEAIAGKFTDSEDYIAMYVGAIKDSKLVRGKSIWIYGYDNITPKFADAMMELAGVAESVNFIVNRSDFGLDEKLISGLRRLAGERGIGFSCEEIPGVRLVLGTGCVSPEEIGDYRTHRQVSMEGRAQRSGEGGEQGLRP